MTDENDLTADGFTRYYSGNKAEKDTPLARVTKDKITLNAAAVREYGLDEYKHANLYIGDGDGLRVAIEPVSGGDVDKLSYSFTDASVSFTGLRTELGLGDWEYRGVVSTEWDAERGLVIVDLAGLEQEADDR